VISVQVSAKTAGDVASSNAARSSALIALDGLGELILKGFGEDPKHESSERAGTSASAESVKPPVTRNKSGPTATESAGGETSTASGKPNGGSRLLRGGKDLVWGVVMLELGTLGLL
jgi:hypothetical protein